MKIRPGVKYSKEEIAQMRDDPDLANAILRGYVFAVDMEGMFELIPYHQAAGGGYQGGAPSGEVVPIENTGTSYGQPVTYEFDKHELPPLVNRTGAQKMASLMDKVGDDLRHYLSGQAGRIITGDETRQVAQAVMDDVDKKFEAEESKKIVRTTGNPYA